MRTNNQLTTPQMFSVAYHINRNKSTYRNMTATDMVAPVSKAVGFKVTLSNIYTAKKACGLETRRGGDNRKVVPAEFLKIAFSAIGQLAKEMGVELSEEFGEALGKLKDIEEKSS